MRIAALLTVVLSASLLAGVAASALAADPKTMVLQPADLPGFKRSSARYVSNVQANRESEVKKDYGKLGRLRGYEVVYEKPAGKGIIVVTSRASTYRTAAGARESLAITAQAVEATEEIDFRRLRVARIGDEARLYKATVTEDGTRVDVFSVVWRSGDVLANVVGGAVAGTAAAADVVALARKQQARIVAR